MVSVEAFCTSWKLGEMLAGTKSRRYVGIGGRTRDLRIAQWSS